MPVRAAWLAATCFGLVAPAAAEVYRCESESGVPVYQGTPNGRNCRAIDLAPLTTIPAPKLPAAGAARAAGAATPGQATAAGQASSAAARPTPDGFPKVDASTQRERDSERRRILEDELRKEEARLAELKGVYKNGQPDRHGDERNYQKYLDRVKRLEDDIGRSEGNIASLRRELGTIRD
ncbi:MAG: DUF4124 domain-containing protein [Burkholderiaceae bacterium]|nr:DUF4124 domain-containing protein [Burkholderiaceae bacterium]MEB2350919.1 DUF4124 domain-containing protein [Burkholderiaceae bacterium]